MNPALRLSLTLLVLANLLFVHITWTVGMIWLGPLYALTLASPLLVRTRERLAYRLAWNGAILLIFTVLVEDATRTGVRYMLEDGLILAAFCQVHLLNNLGRRQKPDLLFFNSFLIALVTCFFSQDLVYLFVFLAYVPLLLLAMQMACLDAGTERRIEWRQLGRIVRSGLARAGIVLGVSGLAFLALPRDFDREGLVGAYLKLETPRLDSEIGFSDEVKLGRSGTTSQSDRVVVRARLQRGYAQKVPMYWRGATFTSYSAGEWLVESRLQPGYASQPQSWRTPRPGRFVRDGDAPFVRLEVELLDSDCERLFLPLETTQLELLGGSDPMLASALRDGTMRYVRIRKQSRSSRAMRYGIACADLPPTPDGRRARGAELRWVHIEGRDVPLRARELAQALRRQAGRDAPQHEIVARFQSYLRARYRYLLPGEDGAAESLEEFFSGHAGGHCEFFATALAVMLRSERIPCRLVTGFLATEWDQTGQTLTIRSQDAHAWVEVLDPRRGWYVVDSTPAAEIGTQLREPSLWDRAESAARALWSRITSFDAKARAAAMTWLGELPARVITWLRGKPGPAALVAALVLAVVLLRLRGRHRSPAAIRRWHRAVARAGVRQEAAETPRELLARAQRSGRPSRRLASLREATAEHEATRYASAAEIGDTVAPSR